MTILAMLIVAGLWSLSAHPWSNTLVFSDSEVDNMFAHCGAGDREAMLAILVPFTLAEAEGIDIRLGSWRDYRSTPCNLTNRGQDWKHTDLVFFFIGDPLLHPNLFRSLMKNLDRSQNSVRRCFRRIRFLSLRDVRLPRHISIAGLFYGIMGGKLLSEYTHVFWMDVTVTPLRPGWATALHRPLLGEPFWVLGAMTMSTRRDHYDRGQYHIHMNALYAVDRCFQDFLMRVAAEFRETTPDLAIHLYRTDYANFREAQHTQHLFRYSRLLIALDRRRAVPVDVISRSWPGAFFLIQDRHYARFGRAVVLGQLLDATNVSTILNDEPDEEEEAPREVPALVENEVKVPDPTESARGTETPSLSESPARTARATATPWPTAAVEAKVRLDPVDARDVEPDAGG